MENKINIAELLKDCPKGMELDCALYDGVEFMEVDEESDTIILRVGNKFIRRLNKYGQDDDHIFSKCLIFPKGKTTWEGFVPPREFKDGDILVHTQNQRSVMSIYHKRSTDFRIKTHCILWDKDEGLSVNMTICCYLDKVRLATEEEKQKLFQAIKENGYKWNPETKTLEKLIEPKFKVGDRVRSIISSSYYTIVDIKNDLYFIQPDDTDKFPYFVPFSDEINYELVPNKFDITTLKPFDKVLVRDNNEQKWTVDLFSFYDKCLVYKYVCVGHYVNQCIPYEDNEHLLGTTDDCDEYYKTWE